MKDSGINLLLQGSTQYSTIWYYRYLLVNLLPYMYSSVNIYTHPAYLVHMYPAPLFSILLSILSIDPTQAAISAISSQQYCMLTLSALSINLQ